MKPTRKITYRNGSIHKPYPCIILEGNWLTKKYGWVLGDTVKIEYGKKCIKISK